MQKNLERIIIPTVIFIIFLTILVGQFIFSSKSSSTKMNTSTTTETTQESIDEANALKLAEDTKKYEEGLAAFKTGQWQTAIDSFVPISDTFKDKMAVQEKIIEARTNLTKEKGVFITSEKDDVREIEFFQDKSSPSNSNQTAIYIYLVNSGTAYIPRLKIQYTASDWLFVKSYRLNIDGIQDIIIPDKVDTDIGYGGTIYEWSDELLTGENYTIIKAIVSSKSAVIRFEGQKYYSDHTITQKEKDALRHVLEYHRAVTGDDEPILPQ